MVNLIIPLAGEGGKFKKAGYKTYKPFVLIKNKPMVDYAIEPFPDDINKYIITSSGLLTRDQEEYLQNKKNCYIIEIESHKEGPSYSIFMAKDQLPLDEPFFITYGDIYWTWNYDKVKKLLDYSGIIFTRRKWHPHLYGNSCSAFCLSDKNNPNMLKEIKEKEPFTDGWMNEILSVGVFYFKSGKDMIWAIKKQIDMDKRADKEFYPSVIFNYLLEDGKEVYLSDVDFFIHFGLPEQLEDFNHWKAAMHKKANEKLDMTNICCMAGSGERMKAVSVKPKAFIEIEGKPMYRFVMDKFNCVKNEIITVDSLADKIEKRLNIIKVGTKTKSQIETLKKALPRIENMNNLLLTSSDAFGIFDRKLLIKKIQDKSPDAVAFTFTPTLMQTKLSSHHTHVSTEGERITNVHIKSKTSENDKGLAGFFWFKSGKIFKELDKIPIDDKNEMIADHFIKYLVDTGYEVIAFNLDNYVHLGTPEEYKEFMFWHNYKELLK